MKIAKEACASVTSCGSLGSTAVDFFPFHRYIPKPEGNREPYPAGHFGFGRRICPGRYLADGSLRIAISSILETLDIRRTLDDRGNEIIPPVELITGLSSHPTPFPCIMQPRDEILEKMIRHAQMSNDSS